MLYLNLSYASINKMCPKVSEKPQRARKVIRLSIQLDVIKHFNHGE